MKNASILFKINLFLKKLFVNALKILSAIVTIFLLPSSANAELNLKSAIQQAARELSSETNFILSIGLPGSTDGAIALCHQSAILVYAQAEMGQKITSIPVQDIARLTVVMDTLATFKRKEPSYIQEYTRIVSFMDFQMANEVFPTCSDTYLEPISQKIDPQGVKKFSKEEIEIARRIAFSIMWDEYGCKGIWWKNWDLMYSIGKGLEVEIDRQLDFLDHWSVRNLCASTAEQFDLNPSAFPWFEKATW